MLKWLVAGLSLGGLGLIPGQSLSDLWWTIWQWKRGSSEDVTLLLLLPVHRRDIVLS